jgi:hypothetical protein
MLPVRILASHNAAMECYRRAMITEQTFEGRKENLNQANKLSRTHATLLEALNRSRHGTRESHSRIRPQAIVGHVEGASLGHASGQTLRAESRVGSLAGRRGWQTVGAGCTAAHRLERPEETNPPTSTVATRRKQFHEGGWRCLPR